ncbi:MAG: hypothetical protein EBR30_06410 [Cytophagia bacterium]|jgi:hypothetical protein|nr:hypothetical protein [Cytophagia bacterium]
MTKIRTIGRLPELNPNWREYTPVENASSPEEMIHWGFGELKHDISATSSYSQAFQDIFVLSVLEEKREGTYLELGCSYPVEINNTYLLETEFDWTGVSVDIDPARTKVFEKSRKNPVFQNDASLIDYDHLLSQYDNNHVDYLQIDIDSESATYAVLDKINFSKFDFSVVTFEHDLYSRGYELKNHMKDIMQQNGYILVCENVCHITDEDMFEDWYINPKYVKEEVWKKFECKNKRAVNILFDV